MKKEVAYTGLEVAIIGMAGRFPGSNNVRAFWDNLSKGNEGIKFFSDEELAEMNIATETASGGKFVNALGVIDDVELFDPELFGFTHTEAEKISPQTRKMFECVWECLEDAGYGDIKESNQIGTYLGANSQLYWEAMARFTNKEINPFELQFLSEKDYTSSLIAHKLNLGGPAIAIQTACSTSLVAVHMASRALLTGDCEMALAGGVHLNFEVKGGYVYEEGMINSSDGHCRTFDASADGTVGGNGSAVVLLKLLKKAIADGDNIYGVIKGSAINNDGKKKMAFSAPSVVGQRDVIRKAMKTARISANTIRFVEAHGTATKLGDPVEVEALKQAFEGNETHADGIALGSVKSNIGHLGAAAGVAGLIKSTLALKYGNLPKTLHFKSPNPKLEIEKSPFFINAEKLALNKGDSPIHAGVSSFGIGGTNAHVILESFDKAPKTIPVKDNVLLLSVHKKSVVSDYVTQLKDFIESENPDLSALAYTFQLGRKQMDHRISFPFSDKKDLLQQLSGFDAEKITTSTGKSAGTTLVLGDLELAQMQAMAATNSMVLPLLETELQLEGITEAPTSFLHKSAKNQKQLLLAKWIFQRAFLTFAKAVIGEVNQVVCEHVGSLAALSFVSDETRKRVRSFIDAGQLTGVVELEGELPFKLVIPSSDVSLAKGKVTQNHVELSDQKSDLIEFSKGAILNSSSGTLENENGLALWQNEKYTLHQCLGKLWENGHEIHWKAGYKDQPGRISAPTLPFHREKYWINTTLEELLQPLESNNVDSKEWLKQPIWKKVAPINSLEKGNDIDVLVITNNALREWNQKIHSDRILELNEAKKGFSAQKASRIIIDLSIDKDTYGEVYASAAKLLDTISGEFIHEKVEVIFVTSNSFVVTGSEELNSFQALISGLALVGGQEYADVDIRFIDIENQLDPLLHATFKEVQDRVLSIRGKYVWTKDFVNCIEEKGLEKPLQSDGTYVITGGFGNIGQVICSYLVSKSCNVALIGRQDVSAEEINKRLTALGVSTDLVNYYSCDITDEATVTRCFSEIRKDFGSIHGVVHGAAVLKDHVIPINRINESELARQLAPKVDGLLNIYNALKKDEADFVLSMSSIATVLGGYGFAIYAGANAVIETISEQLDEAGRTRYATIGWDAWFTEAMLTSKNANEILQSAITEVEGKELFERVLNVGNPMSFTSKTALQVRLEKWVNKKKIDTPEEVEIAEVQYFERGDLTTEYIAPETKLEKEVTRIWRDFFRIDKIGVLDDFYDLGGDSLKGMELVKSYSKLLDTKVSVDISFDAFNVRETAEILEKDHPEACQAYAEQESSTGAFEETAKQRIIEEKFALSPQQRRIYFMHILRENNVNYNLPRVIPIPDNMSLEDLSAAFNQIIKRHDALKTAFTVEDDEPKQYIDYTVSLAVEDADRDYTVIEAKEHFTQSFDLSKAPLVRAIRFKTPEGKCYLFHDIHHIITDGRSKDIMEQEIDLLLSGKALPPKGKEYYDYVKYQESEAYQTVLEKEKDYWFNEFVEIPEPLNLPYDFERENHQSFEGKTISFDLDEKLSEELKKLSIQYKCSTFVTMLAAFKLTLHKMSNNQEVVVGTPVLGRTDERFDQTIGLFVNTLAVKSSIHREDSLKEFISQVKEKVVNAVKHQELPFDALVDHLGGKRMANKNPLFDVMFNLQNYKHITLEGEGIDTLDNAVEGISRFDLNFQGLELSNIFKFNVVYTKSLFEEATIKRFIKLYQAILNQLVDHGDRQISSLEIDKEDARKQLEFTGKEQPVSFTDIRSWFAQSFKENSDNEAIVCGNERLTYEQLGKQVAIIEQDLESRTNANNLIAVCMKPSVALIATIIAIVNRGKSFLPIDIDTPLDRIDYMLTDGNVNVLYTNLDQSKGMVKDNLDIVIVQNFDAQISVALQEPEIDAQSPIYTIYTSGSTGTPKGVSISHGNIYNYSNWAIDQTGFTPKDRCILINNFSFDALYTVFFGALCTGASLHLLSKEEYVSPETLNEYIKKEEISYIKFTPSMGSLILQYEKVRDCLNSLRFVMIGGEKINPVEAKRFQEIVPSARIMNHYGPTETTIGAIAKEIVNWEEFIIRPTIGAAIYNTQLYVLDDQLNMVPHGAIGELYIAGDNVSLGYIGQAESQNKAFIHNPFGKGKAYKTGDLVRWTSQGEIQIIGRKDDQVKVNGHRVQLAEIEKILDSHVEVNESRVYLKSTADNDLLVAYVKTESDVNLKELRVYLESKLPVYMIPSFFVPVVQFSVNKNGKVDEKKLPDYRTHSIALTSEIIVPENAIETKILAAWKEVLGVNQISTEDNFFEIGGNSFKLVKLNSVLNREFDKSESITSFFEYPNIKRQAKLYSDSNNESDVNSEEDLKKEISGFEDVLSIINDK